MPDPTETETETETGTPLHTRTRAIVESDPFEALIATLIVLNALVMGLETVPDLAHLDDIFWIFFTASQAIFVVEILLRLFASGPRYRTFFTDRWNIFDFVIVALSLAPMVGQLSFLARVFRVLRVLRVISLWRRRAARGDS